MANFDQIFDPAYSTVDLFTNRTGESVAFETALFRHFECVLDGSASLGRPERHNVLTFYGVGGIGKTELSQRLERWLLDDLSDPGEWGPSPRFDHPVRTLRVDFHGSPIVDAAAIVLRLRAAVADAGRRFPAFDIGLASWWALAHPGTALPDLRNARGFDVKGQINDTVSELLSEVGARVGVGPLTVRTGSQLIETVRSRVLHSRALRACTPLEAVVEQARIDPSQYVAASLAGLLSWDLERLTPSERPLVAAFADAAEYVLGGDRSQERRFNRIVHLTPTVLWTITSRNSLDWDSLTPASPLPATGTRIWPDLGFDQRDEPRQHLVGDLSDVDVRRYLATASGRSGVPVLGPEIVERIHGGAHGLPLYLDMSLSMARSAGQGALDPAAFGRPLPELVTRIFTDLPEEEREVARTASLLPRFDAELLVAAAGGPIGNAVRFCRRSLVSHDDDPMFPHRLHDVVRASIADESVNDPGAWTEADRRDRAQTLLDALRKRHDGAMDHVEQRLEILSLSALLCREHDFHAPWLLNALAELPGFGIIAERLPPPDGEQWMDQVSDFFRAFQGTTTRQRITHLNALRNRRRLAPDIDQMTRRWLAYSHRSCDDLETALEILRELLAESPESPLLRHQVARTLRSMGDYDGLRRHLARYPPGESSVELRLRADLAHDRGELAEAIAGTSARASYLRAVGRHRTALENEVTVLWRKALSGRATLPECEAAISRTDGYGIQGILRTSLAAKVLCLPDDHEAARTVLAEGRTIAAAADSAVGWREWTSGMIYGLRSGDQAYVEEIRAEWTAGSSVWSPNRQVVERLFTFAGYPATYPPVDTGDGDDRAAVDDRWHTIFTDLLQNP